MRTFYVRWIESKAKALKASTLVDYKLTFRLHILPSLGDVKLREITPGDIQEWIDALDLRAASANKTYRYLRACLNNAEAQGS